MASMDYLAELVLLIKKIEYPNSDGELTAENRLAELEAQLRALTGE